MRENGHITQASGREDLEGLLDGDGRGFIVPGRTEDGNEKARPTTIVGRTSDRMLCTPNARYFVTKALRPLS